MSKKNRLYVLISLALIFGLLNLILFITLPDGIANTFNFWLAWFFTFIFSYGCCVFSIIYTSKIKKYEDILLPPTLYVTAGFTIVYLVIGFIFMYWKSITWQPIVIVEVLLSVAYFIVLFAFLRTTTYISENDKKQKDKVFFIRDLQSDIEYVASITTDDELKNKLMKLAEDVRFSDPMSHDSLSRIEDELKELAFKMNSVASDNNNKELEKLIKEADSKLKYRNNKCINLK